LAQLYQVMTLVTMKNKPSKVCGFC